MIERKKLEEIARQQKEVNKLQAALNNEYNKYSDELFKRAKEVLKWKDENCGQQFLKYRSWGYIKDIKENHVVLCFPDVMPALPSAYYNVSFDELYSDDWKEKALEDYRHKVLEKAEKERRRIEMKKIEEMKADYEQYLQLKAKFEGEGK